MSSISTAELLGALLPPEELRKLIEEENEKKKNQAQKYLSEDTAQMSPTKLRRLRTFGRLPPEAPLQSPTQPKAPLPISTPPEKVKQKQEKPIPQNDEQQLEDMIARKKTEFTKLSDKLLSLDLRISSMAKKVESRRAEKQRSPRSSHKPTQGEAQEEETPKLSKKETEKLEDFVTNMPEMREYRGPSKNPYSPRHNIYYVSEIVKGLWEPKSMARAHLEDSIEIISYFKQREKEIPSDEKIEKRKVRLPKHPAYKNKKTIIFDLDETLIHCNDDSSSPCDARLPIKFPNGKTTHASINVRPYAMEILKNLHQDFELIVFTASHSCYANVVIDYLDPTGKCIQHRLYREHCFPAHSMNVKDLRILDRAMTEMVLVDNAAYSFSYQLDNGVPIIPYMRGKQDFELQALEKYLRSLALVEDVRVKNYNTFRLRDYHNYEKNPQGLVADLYCEK